MNPVAFSTLACPHWSMETIIDKAVAFGYDAIEWRGGPEGHIQPMMSSREKEDLRKSLGNAGLIALAIMTYTSFVSPLAEERQSNVDELCRYADLAAELGATYIRAFLGELPEGTSLNSLLYENISNCLQAAAEHATSVGVKIALEPHDNFTRSVDVLPIFDSDRSYSNLRIIWDIGNTFAIGEEPEEGFEILKDRLAYVQVKDGKRHGPTWQLCSVGDGDVPLARAFELLSQYGYEGALSVEWEYAWHPELDPPEVALPAALHTVRKLLSAVRSEST